MRVTDINDNAPTFEQVCAHADQRGLWPIVSACHVSSQDTYTAILMEDASVGESVVTLSIRDLDSRVGGAGDLQFRVIRGDSAAFTLNATALADGWWDVVVETATVSHTLLT